MAAFPNLHVKISGLGMFTNGVTRAHARQVIRDVIQIFGIERTIYGSNFPLEKLHASYADFFAINIAQCCRNTPKPSSATCCTTTRCAFIGSNAQR